MKINVFHFPEITIDQAMQEGLHKMYQHHKVYKLEGKNPLENHQSQILNMWFIKNMWNLEVVKQIRYVCTSVYASLADA